MTVGRWRAARRFRRDVARHGWLVHYVADADPSPLHFTVGLTERDLPEVFAYGLPAEQGGLILNDVAERMLDGLELTEPTVFDDLLEGDYNVHLWSVTEPPVLGAAYLLYGDRVRARQLVVPDEANRMPWHPDHHDSHRQPLFFDPPS
ncbi:DUF4262 domain-containing protein [Spongisporangium articulatum]|uniref:DUF4262 domain-containing protein n=1 Tax=Spongisporangium articulatum TaxID=3362603 RepID=A0ABW8AIQ3_9ACTN